MSRQQTIGHRPRRREGRPREWLINLLIYVLVLGGTLWWLHSLASLLDESLQRWVAS